MSKKVGKESQYSFVTPSSALAGVGGVTCLVVLIGLDRF